MPIGQTTLTIIGNLTNDPKISRAKDGSTMARFTIASNPRFYEQSSGTWRDGEPLFLHCTAWRHLADHIGKSLTKGQRVIATGALRQFEWSPADNVQATGYALDIEDIGPSLRWATATATRTKTVSSANGDTGTFNGMYDGDEPPF
ncbi:single-stranded DNA-binding protein [Nonomuraea angiospora]|uniref:single-stranded DNA-binding protein n=1 Tax=Nonomuraea angiospora TaxID=46172 RepID=UPI00344BB7E7